MCNFNKCKRNDYLISSVAPILHSKPFLMVTELVASKVVEPLSRSALSRGQWRVESGSKVKGQRQRLMRWDVDALRGASPSAIANSHSFKFKVSSSMPLAIANSHRHLLSPLAIAQRLYEPNKYGRRAELTVQKNGIGLWLMAMANGYSWWLWTLNLKP